MSGLGNDDPSNPLYVSAPSGPGISLLYKFTHHASTLFML